MSSSAILTFHSLDDSGSVISYEPAAFERLLEGLAGAHIPVVPLSEVCARPGSVSLTFDDAFANFHQVALPLLERYRMPATVFAVTDYCGRDNNWPLQSPRVPILPLMSWDRLRDAAGRGVTIGSHTLSHPNLAKLDSPGAIRQELRQSRERIEQEIGRPVDAFAFPYGGVPAGLAELNESGYRLAVTTELRYAGPDDHSLTLPRLDSYYLKNPAVAATLFGRVCRANLGLRHLIRKVRGLGR